MQNFEYFRNYGTLHDGRFLLHGALIHKTEQ